jgi:hypothetical protein
MTNSAVTIDEVLAQATAPLVGSSGSGLAAQLDRLNGQLQLLQSVNQAAVESTRTNTQAVQGSTASSGGSERSVGGTILSALGTGLGLSPLLSGVLRLFGGGGGGSTESSPLVKFELPASRNVNAGISEAVPGAAFAVDYAQGAAPRAVTNSVATSQITVQVQAMDSRSFLDHSNDIALAVRQAMLESSVLSDVVREA